MQFVWARAAARGSARHNRLTDHSLTWRVILFTRCLKVYMTRWRQPGKLFSPPRNLRPARLPLHVQGVCTRRAGGRERGALAPVMEDALTVGITASVLAAVLKYGGLSPAPRLSSLLLLRGRLLSARANRPVSRAPLCSGRERLAARVPGLRVDRAVGCATGPASALLRRLPSVCARAQAKTRRGPMSFSNRHCRNHRPRVLGNAAHRAGYDPNLHRRASVRFVARALPRGLALCVFVHWR